MTKCELCGGCGRVYSYSGYGVEVGPCPNCNEAYRKQKQQEFEKAIAMPEWVRSAIKDTLKGASVVHG